MIEKRILLDLPEDVTPTATLTTPTVKKMCTTTEKSVKTATIIIFHDFNGNGIRDDFEPLLANISVQSDIGKTYFTNASGYIKVKAKQYVIITPKDETFRYVTWSTGLVKHFEDGLVVPVNKTKIEIPLTQGFLTFPLKRKPIVLSPFGEYRPKGVPKYHVGTDFYAVEGENVYAPAPGKIRIIEDDIYSGQCIWIDISDLDDLYGSGEANSYVICHIKVKDGLSIGDFIERGELIGWVDYPEAPHIHFQLMGTRFNNSQKEIVALPLYEEELEVYTTYRFDEYCKLREIYHPSVWTVWNKPIIYYKKII